MTCVTRTALSLGRHEGRARFGALFAAGAIACACAPSARPAWRRPSAVEWERDSSLLHDLREETDRAPFTARVRVAVRDGRSGRVMDGRGAVAFAPGRAVRMILVGAGGTTLLDAWVTMAQWRIAVPAMEFVKRGEAEDPSDLPVGFLRWWFLRPLAGALFAASSDPSQTTWLLRDEGAVIELRLTRCDERVCLSALRRRQGRGERIGEWRHGAVRGPGDRVHYQDDVSGLAVDMFVEERATAAPEDAAFRDPDLDLEPP